MRHSPYVDLDRGAWAKLGENAPSPLSAAELDGLRSLGDPVDLDEVREVYLPLTRLLALHIDESGRLYETYRAFLAPGEEPPARTPFVIGIAGSVSVGKSTIARLLQPTAGPPARPSTRRADHHRRVPASQRGAGTTGPDGPQRLPGVLRPRRALLRFVRDVKAGRPEVGAPVYSHLVYDVLPDEQMIVRSPDILLAGGPQRAAAARAGPRWR